VGWRLADGRIPAAGWRLGGPVRPISMAGCLVALHRSRLDRGGFGGGDFTATQEGNLLTVERTMTGPDGTARTTTSKYTLDGKESINTARMGESKSVATWSSDGKKLTIKTTRTMSRNGESTTMTSTEVWSLTDSKTLQIESTTSTPGGERKQTSVYNKK